MKKVDLSVTVSRTDTEHQFKGTVTFKNEEGKEIVYDFLITNPEQDELDIRYSNETDTFYLKGLPSNELLWSVSERQQFIFALSFELLDDAIRNTQQLSLSQKTTNTLRAFGGDVHGSMQCSISIEEKPYNTVFEQ